jgi:hypothetical protein
VREKTGWQQQLSSAASYKFLKCVEALADLRGEFKREGGGDILNAIRTYMVGAVVFIKNLDVSDVEFRDLLHGLLDMAIDEYQHNGRIYDKETS